jgi:hypothetical protein
MPKTFYTERDISDLADRGVTSLEVNDDVVLTEVARDTARARGVKLVHSAAANDPAADAQAELIHRVKAAVLARLGEQVDAALLDAAVTKVVSDQK